MVLQGRARLRAVVEPLLNRLPAGRQAVVNLAGAEREQLLRKRRREAEAGPSPREPEGGGALEGAPTGDIPGPWPKGGPFSGRRPDLRWVARRLAELVQGPALLGLGGLLVAGAVPLLGLVGDGQEVTLQVARYETLTLQHLAD